MIRILFVCPTIRQNNSDPDPQPLSTKIRDSLQALKHDTMAIAIKTIPPIEPN